MIPLSAWPSYLVSNTAGLLAFALLFWRRSVIRWTGVVVFAVAAALNAGTAWLAPARYLDYARLTPSLTYRHFILGWFSAHITAVVLAIAAGQLASAFLLAERTETARRTGAAGALVFLTAIAPLGVGSAFPFSLTFGAAIAMAVIGPVALPPALQRLTVWAPRVIAAAVVALLAALALDGWANGATPFERSAAIWLHLAPAALALGVLLLAWRWPRVGGGSCFVLAIAYAALTRGRIEWMTVIAVPLIVEGALFFLSAGAPDAPVQA